jgi:integrase
MLAKKFDRLFGGVRITRSSGVDRAKWEAGNKAARREFDYRDGLLTKLWERGQKDIIVAFARGEIDIQDIVTADRLGRLGGMASDIATLKPLWKTWEEIIPRLRTDKGRPISAASRANYTYSMKRLKALRVLSEEALVADLETVDWTKPFSTWDASPAAWNHLGRALSRFLTVILGDKFHPLRRKVAREFPKMDEHPRVPSLSLQEFRRIIDMMPPHYQAIAVVLAYTGMRLGELAALTPADLDPVPQTLTIDGREVKVYGVNIRDAKTAAGVRKIYVAEEFWPYVLASVPMPISHWYLRDVWNSAVDRAFPERDMDIRLHDLRHFAAQQLSNAGTPEAQIQAQLGHADPSMTRMYSMQTARAEVAAKMAGVMGSMAPTPQAMVGG